MKVVIPMAGRGSRFANKGWQIPKPIIEIDGQPMLFWALRSIDNLEVSEVIFILLQEHETDHKVSQLIKEKISLPTRFIFIEEVTEGQLCTVLKAKHFINTTEDVLVMASDSLVISHKLERDIQNAKSNDWSGLISVADLPGDRWSFARTNEDNLVIQVAEKVRISDYASTGIYYFTNGKTLVHYAEDMISKKEKTRGEYYVIPVYQKMIEQGKKIGITKANAMWDMGTPEAKEKFEDDLEEIKQTLKQ